jgi:hypothetical protein
VNVAVPQLSDTEARSLIAELLCWADDFKHTVCPSAEMLTEPNEPAGPASSYAPGDTVSFVGEIRTFSSTLATRKGGSHEQKEQDACGDRCRAAALDVRMGPR